METNEVVNNAANTVNNAQNFRNKLTAAQLMRAEGAGLDLIPGKKPGIVCFSCGTKFGYVSHAITDNLDTVKLEDMRYAEVRATTKEGKPILKEGKQAWIPTLFLASTKRVIKHFSL